MGKKELVLAVTFSVLVALTLSPLVSKIWADSPIAIYNADTPWLVEIVYLDHLANSLRKNPKFIGCVSFYSDEKFSRAELTKRLQKSVNYLVRFRKVPRNRLRLKYVGKEYEAFIYLESLDKIEANKSCR
jgi:hypothetical protein